MLHYLNGHIYCETSDINDVNNNSLLVYLKRSRDGKTPYWTNISNPAYNGKNAKRLLAVHNLPDDVKQGVLARFSLAVEDLENGLQKEAAKGEDSQAMAIANEAVHKVAKVAEKFVHGDIKHYLDTHYQLYTGHYLQMGIHSLQVIKYARTCALVQLIWNQMDTYEAVANPKDRDRLLKVLHLNLSNALTHQLEVSVPQSNYRLSEWLHKVMQAKVSNQSIYEIIQVKGGGNTNRERFNEVQKEYARVLRTKNNALPMAHIYSKLLDYAKDNLWWGWPEDFNPIDVSTLQKYFKKVDNSLAAQREGKVKHMNLYVPTVQRTLPLQKNAMWGIDGSPMDVLVFGNGKSRQDMNSIRVYDYASCKFIGLHLYKGKGEKGTDAISALQDAVKRTGYLPKILQLDGGPAGAEIERWCKQHGVIFQPAKKGLARAKFVENLICHFGQILRENKAYSGQNRTALGRNSQVSEDGYKEAQGFAKNFKQTALWLSNEAMDAWNNRKMKTLERKPCGKTPNELWQEKESATALLDGFTKVAIAGISHRVRLTIDGLTIQHQKQTYTYFPNLFTNYGFEKGLEVYEKIPLKHHPKSGQLSLYINEYGDNEALVFDKDIDKGGKYIDTWILKPTVSMVASLEGDSEKLAVFLSFQKAVRERAYDMVKEAKQLAECYEMNTNAGQKNRMTQLENRYDKEALHEEEMGDFENINGEMVNTSTGEVKTYINPFTQTETSIIK
ncbi:MAG: transposase family protein [Sphingobacteriaceae bacterium]|nr:transposase family protein [Sphingobacteriaceae bacterium]